MVLRRRGAAQARRPPDRRPGHRAGPGRRRHRPRHRLERFGRDRAPRAARRLARAWPTRRAGPRNGAGEPLARPAARLRLSRARRQGARAAGRVPLASGRGAFLEPTTRWRASPGWRSPNSAARPARPHPARRADRDEAIEALGGFDASGRDELRRCEGRLRGAAPARYRAAGPRRARLRPDARRRRGAARWPRARRARPRRPALDAGAAPWRDRVAFLRRPIARTGRTSPTRRWRTLDDWLAPAARAGAASRTSPRTPSTRRCPACPLGPAAPARRRGADPLHRAHRLALAIDYAAEAARA